MSNSRDVIDIDGTKRTFDIDSAELGGMSADQKSAVVVFRGPHSAAVSVTLGRTSYRVLAGWMLRTKRARIDSSRRVSSSLLLRKSNR
jgi:hypothetical protein